MILQRCHITGFGGLAGRALEFDPLLNLVFAPNEGGKTTLQRFLIAMLYGQLRPDLRAQRRLEAWVESYKPWAGMEYGGTMVCRLQAGTEIEVLRAFGREDARLEIRAATGEDVTRSYEQQRNGDVLFARTHLGLPKELFESVAVIRENRAGDLDGRETIRDRIANLAQSGDEDLSVRSTLEFLEKAIEEIGSERAPTRPYRVALDKLQSLQSEKQVLDARRLEFESQITERNEMAERMAATETAFHCARAAAAAARWAEYAEKVRCLEELQGELDALRPAIAGSIGRIDFPAQRLEELEQLVGARTAVEQRQALVRARSEAAAKCLQSASQARAALQPYGELDPDVDAHRVTEWFIGWLRSSVQRDESQKWLDRSTAEAESLGRRLSELGPAFADPAVDWERKALESAESERAGTERIGNLAERIKGLTAELEALGSRSARWVWSAAAGLVAAACILPAWDFLGLWPALTSAALLLASSVFLFTRARKCRAPRLLLLQEIGTCEREQAELRRKMQQGRNEVEQAMRASGCGSMDEFLAAAEEAERARQAITMQEQRRQDVWTQREKAAAEASELFVRLQETLARVGLQCSPATLKTQVDSFREGLRRFREAEETCRARRREAESAGAEERAVADEAAGIESRLSGIFAAAGVNSPAEFRRGCEERSRLLELQAKEAARQKELARSGGGQTLEQWRERLRQAAQEKDRLAAVQGIPARACDAGILRLPYVPSSQQAAEEERKLAAELAELREEQARIEERIAGAFSGCRPLSEVEEDLAQTQQEVEALALNREALQVALETIQRLSREQQEVLAPRLNRLVEDRFLRLSRGRYAEVKIDLDFNVRVREINSSSLRPAAALSRGTQDQLYLALRFGVLEMVAGAEEPCPSLLDEPFAAYDRDRLEEAFALLDGERLRRQLFLFTCREDVRDLALEHGARLVDLCSIHR